MTDKKVLARYKVRLPKPDVQAHSSYGVSSPAFLEHHVNAESG